MSFTRVGRFPTVVYLAPEPDTPFARLTAEIAARYPDHPPYGGAFEEVVPHLTVAESATAPLDQIALAAADHLPIRHRVTMLEVLVEGVEGRWHGRWRLPSGRSDGDELAVLAPGHPQPVADLPDRRVGADRLDDRGHQVALATGDRLESVHRARPGLG